MSAQSLSRVPSFVTPWTIACKALLSMGFSRQECWSGFHFLLQRIFLTQGLNLGLQCCRQILYHLGYREGLLNIGIFISVVMEDFSIILLKSETKVLKEK